MRAAPHAGSRRSRCPHPRAIAPLLAVALAALATLGERGSPHAESRRMVRASAAAGAPVAAPPFDNAGYWAVADSLQRRVEPLWNEGQGIYDPAGGGVGPLVNAGI